MGAGWLASGPPVGRVLVVGRGMAGRALPDYVEAIPMPALSPTMESGSIAGWNMAAGDELSAGDVLCEIETDKATVDFEMQDDAVLAAILFPNGSSDIPVGTPIALAVEDAGDLATFRAENFTADDLAAFGAGGGAAADGAAAVADDDAGAAAVSSAESVEAPSRAPMIQVSE